jgi:hypothetical protein
MSQRGAMMVLPVVETLVSYVRRHPEELLRLARNAVGLRFGVPISALRWAAGRLNGKKAPRDIEIQAVPPGIRAGATVDLMGTTVRAKATVYVEDVRLGAELLRIELRLADVSLRVLDDTQDTPVAALLKSGALDLSKPGNLAAYMPKRPPFLVEAKDDRIALDLMKHPRVAKDERIRRALAIVLPLVTVRGVQTDPEHLDVALRALPDGFGEVFSGFKRGLGRA